MKWLEFLISLFLGELNCFSFSIFSPVVPLPGCPQLWLEEYSTSPRSPDLGTGLVWRAHSQGLCSPPPGYIPEVGLPDELWLPVRALVLCGPLPGLEALALLAPRGRGRVALRGRRGVVLHGPARKQVPMCLVLVEVLLVTSLGVAAPMLGEQAMGCTA